MYDVIFYPLIYFVGALTLVKSLDFESRKSHKLIVIAFDDIDKSKALNGISEVIIEVLNVNEFPPEFINVSGSVYIKVEEGIIIDKIYQVNCIET